ncbi:phage minor head protein [Anabaena sp. PCC 7108]|uniref:phage head morphogenesis protein n=1 Tax=Anabaena sp. PCC 7108 TaxID=163908 RepID=UPI00034DC26A|nr:phage minor head protein [Anabaena sp. PCC 7108]
MVEYKSLPFDQAINFFRSKVNVPTATWRDVWQQEHDIAFVVAGATKAALLADFRQAVDDGIAQGKTRAEFQKDFDRIVETHGWQHKGGREWRANIIYGTNLRTAYAAGRYEQMTDPDVLKMRPYWMWKHGNSREPRLHHLAMDGKVFPATDPWWNTNYPPSGWGCKCMVTSLSKRDIQRRGLEVEPPPQGDTYQWTNPAGQKVTVKNSPDPGWGYAPGRSTQQQQVDVLKNILQTLPNDLRRQVEQDAVKQVQKLETGDIQKQGIFGYLLEQLGQDVQEVVDVPTVAADGSLTGYFRTADGEFFGVVRLINEEWRLEYGRSNSRN